MDYKDYINENKDEMVSFLRQLVQIKSVKDKPFKTKEGVIYPFGRGVEEAYELVMEKAREYGFDTANVDNYGGHCEFGGYILDEEGDIERTCPYTMGILAHLDVVPEGDGWTHEPFSGYTDQECIFGRGTQDDKGPLVATLFAMKALKESGFVPAKKVRLILGLDEETGWEGMEYYFKYQDKPDFGFTPDGDFPVINGEKGITTFQLAKKFSKTKVKGLELRSISGGTAPNMVPANARAVVRAPEKEIYEKIKEEAVKFRSDTSYRINIKGVGKSLEISAQGKSAHGARPEDGLNAISVLMAFLGRLNFVNEDFNEIIDFYNKYIGFDTEGKLLGCNMEDEKSGKLTMNLGMISLDSEAIKMTINARYPVTFTDEEIYGAIEPIGARYNMGIIKVRHQAPIYMEEDHPLINALMSVYRKNTGDNESKPLVIGGGSYARAIDKGVAFGGLFPGDEDRMHQKDECIKIGTLIKMAEIYADAIYQLSCDEEMEF